MQINKHRNDSYTIHAAGAAWSVRYLVAPSGPGVWRASTGDLPYVDDDRRVFVAPTLRRLLASLTALEADYADAIGG